jgi:hypothetical protein
MPPFGDDLGLDEYVVSCRGVRAEHSGSLCDVCPLRGNEGESSIYNRFHLVRDVDALPPRDHELLKRYVYW